jgi:hypothetical protein
MPSDNLKPTKTEDRLSRYSSQLSQDCRNYITQNFDLKNQPFFGKKYGQIYSIIMGKLRSQKAAEDTPWPEYRVN